jgi:hypothetical protein
MEDNAYNRQISKEVHDMNKKYIGHLSKVGRALSGGRMCSCHCGGAMSAGAISAGRKPVRRVKGGALDESVVDDMEGGNFGSFMKGLFTAPLHLLGLGQPTGGSISRQVGGAKRGRKRGGADNEYELPPPLTAAQRQSYEEVAPIVDRSKKPEQRRATMSGIPPAVLRAAKPKGKGMEGSGILDLFQLPLKMLSSITGSAKPRGKKGAAKSKSPWIAHVKAFAAKHSMSYSDALKHPSCRASYRK